MVELYYNSGQFVHTLQAFEQVFESPFFFYEALADFYERKGYYINSPARSRRYEVLLEFARCVDKEREELYRELLTYDMYLRERCKSRPSFARDLTCFKEEIRQRRSDKQEHIEVFYYPVWEEAFEIKREDPCYIRFSYDRRNPLNHNAETEEV